MYANSPAQAIKIAQDIEAKEYAIEKITNEGIEVLSHYPWQDKDKIRAQFVEYAHKKAEDVIYVMEPQNKNPIQLTLF